MAFDDGVKTVSGSIAHTEDAATKVPFVSVKCGIAPTLTGKSAIEATQTGVNLFDNTSLFPASGSVSSYYFKQFDYNSNLIPLIKLQAGVTYTFSLDITSTIEPFNFSVGCGNGSYSSDILTVYNKSNGRISITFTPTTVQLNNGDIFAFRCPRYQAQNTFDYSVSNVQLEVGSTATTYEPYTAPTVLTVNLGRTIYGGTADVVTGEGEDENGNAFTFTPITPTPESVGKVNNVYCNTGDTELTYYDNAHGFSEVTVNKTRQNLLDTAIAETKTNNSVSITCDGNGKYTATGTATGASANITFTLKTPCTIKSGMYLHLMNSGAVGSVAITLQKQDNTTIYAPALSPANRIADLSSYVGQTIYSIRFYVTNGASFEMSLTPMVCFSSTAHDYEPYEAVSKTAYLHKVIYGGQADVVRGTCKPKNILDSADASHTFTSGTNTQYQIGTVALKGGVTYTFSAYQEDALTSNTRNTLVIYSNGQYTYEYGTGTNYHNQVGVHSMQYTPDTDKTVALILWVHTPSNDVTYSEFQVEKGSAPTDFAPHFDPFTFPPISMSTDEGENTLYADQGDSTITYRKAVD